MAFLEAIETEEQIKNAAKALAPMPVSFSITCPDHITDQVAHDQLRLAGENTMVPAQKACRARCKGEFGTK